ncbi:hypothetical protein BHE74_00058781, partial [Ensete ventricosum]
QADVWSCGVTLYVMLVGAYPFEDQKDPKNFRKTIGHTDIIIYCLLGYKSGLQRIMSVQYKIPDYVHISQDCKQLISRIFVANPMKVIHTVTVFYSLFVYVLKSLNELCVMQRITIREIKSHPWFLKNLPRELTEAAQAVYYRKDNNAPTYSTQKVDEIMKILTEARTPPKPSQPVPGTGGTEDEFEEEEGKEENQEEDDDDDEYDKTVKAVHASGEF